MNQVPSWRPLSVPRREALRQLGDTDFARLARSHAFMVAGDALVALALAGSLFFSIDPSSARWRVALYLLLTMAPFAVVAPLIGPVIDRTKGGRRAMIIVSAGARAAIAFVMINDLDSLLLFPEAFAMLVLGKAYHVAKSAVVPATVDGDAELVQANSRLSVISGLAGFVAVIPGGIVLALGGSSWVMALAMVVFIAATVMAFRIPAIKVADHSPDELERAELRSAGVLLAVSAMGTLRWIVGFVAFLLAFDFRGASRDPGPVESLGEGMKLVADPDAASFSDGQPLWHFGVVLAASAIGGLLGSALAPAIRRILREEAMLTSALGFAAAIGLLAAFAIFWRLGAATLVAFTIGLAAAGGKQAFDAVVQRDAPDANRGRSFARFEARFQIFWVFGAFIPVVLTIPARLGYFTVGVVGAFAAIAYVVSLGAAHRAHGHVDPAHGDLPPPSPESPIGTTPDAGPDETDVMPSAAPIEEQEAQTEPMAALPPDPTVKLQPVEPEPDPAASLEPEPDLVVPVEPTPDPITPVEPAPDPVRPVEPAPDPVRPVEARSDVPVSTSRDAPPSREPDAAVERSSPSRSSNGSGLPVIDPIVED